ncbi:hypothetical protein C5167_018358 [Papaver somniferum]|uniref:Uncharacterized protein n=1 Tax=Papaver somniferum TaxID=3469 RepID=A0A4Y7IP98_PAPSO|nr:hypothetical protein C5167_018358 [Papaver somniferum]
MMEEDLLEADRGFVAEGGGGDVEKDFRFKQNWPEDIVEAGMEEERAIQNIEGMGFELDGRDLGVELDLILR